MKESSKLHDSKVKKSLLIARKVKVWFWDTRDEYSGEAVALTSTDLTALLKIGTGTKTTLVPNPAVMEGLIKHLTGRVVEFKVSGQGTEIPVKGTIREIQRDFENPRRLLLLAKLQPPPEKNAAALDRLGRSLPQA